MEFDNTLYDEDVRVTEPAAAKLAEIVRDADEPYVGVRVYMSGGGCSGMTTGMTFAKEITEYDMIKDLGETKLIIDVQSRNYVEGAEIDYITDVGRERFVFNDMFLQQGGSGACGGCGGAGGSYY